MEPRACGGCLARVEKPRGKEDQGAPPLGTPGLRRISRRTTSSLLLQRLLPLLGLTNQHHRRRRYCVRLTGAEVRGSIYASGIAPGYTLTIGLC